MSIPITLVQGVYKWFVSVLDRTGIRFISQNSTFTLDLTLPNVTLNSPLESYINDTSSITNISFNCSASDNYALSNITLYLTDRSNNNFQPNRTSAVAGISDNTNWTLSLPIGNYTWNCLAADSAGNLNFSQSNRTILLNFTDTDSDGIPNGADNLEGNESNVLKSGVSNLNITVGGNSSRGTYNGTHEIVFYDSLTPIINFTHNFSQTALDLNKVRITKSTNSVLINLSGQLQPEFNKTLYIEDNNFISLCAKDSEISSISDLSSSCNGENETDLTSCISNSNETIIGNLTCLDLGSRIQVSNLRFSALLGTPAPTPEVSESGGGGGGSIKSTPIECYKDSDCNKSYSCYKGKCVKLFDVEILEVSPVVNSSSFEIKYLIKGMADIKGDVIVKFWIENAEEKIMLGQDAIYLGSFEEKIKTTTLNLPSDTSESYDFYVQVNFEKYSAESFRKVNIILPEGLAQEILLSPGSSLIWALVIAAIILIILMIAYYLRKDIAWLIFYLRNIKYLKEQEYCANSETGDAQQIVNCADFYSEGKAQASAQSLIDEPLKCSETLPESLDSEKMIGRQVFSAKGDKIGYVFGSRVIDNKIYGWFIVPDSRYNIDKNILIKSEHIKLIGKILVVNEKVEEYLENYNTEDNSDNN